VEHKLGPVALFHLPNGYLTSNLESMNIDNEKAERMLF